MWKDPAACGVVGWGGRGYLVGMLKLIDRTAKRLQWPFIVLAIASLPVFLFGVGYMFKLLFFAAPWWATLAVSVSWFTVLLGLASLLDQLELRKSWRELTRQIELADRTPTDRQ